MLPIDEPRGDAGLFVRPAAASDAAALGGLLGELSYPATEAEALERIEHATIMLSSPPDDDGLALDEISAMARLFNYFNRVNEALLMEPTKPGEGL